MFLFDINNGAERHSNGDNDNHFDNHNNLVITATIRPPPQNISFHTQLSYDRHEHERIAMLMHHDQHTVNVVAVQPRPSTRPAQTHTRTHSPHRAVCSGAHRRQVLVPLRNLPHGLVQLLPVKSWSGRHVAEPAAEDVSSERKEENGENGDDQRGGGTVDGAAVCCRAELLLLLMHTHTHTHRTGQ